MRQGPTCLRSGMLALGRPGDRDSESLPHRLGRNSFPLWEWPRTRLDQFFSIPLPKVALTNREPGAAATLCEQPLRVLSAWRNACRISDTNPGAGVVARWRRLL